jgi:hypothetical protein
MGASTSVLNNIYVSYDLKLRSNKTKHIINICNELKKDSNLIISSDLLSEQVSKLPMAEKITNIESIISQSKCLIIFISEDTLKAPFQMIEMNDIIFSTKKIIYVMINENYTPINTPYLQLLIKNNKWFLLKDEELLKNIKELINQ